MMRVESHLGGARHSAGFVVEPSIHYTRHARQATVSTALFILGLSPNHAIFGIRALVCIGLGAFRDLLPI